MPQATDVTIAGVGYALAPGGYKREQAGSSRRLVGRVAVDRFGAGQLAAYQRDGEGVASGGGWRGVGVGPALGGQAVEPFPHVETHTQTFIAATIPSTTRRVASVVTNSRCFVAIGQRVFHSVALASPTWADLTVTLTLPVGAVVTELARMQDDLMVFAVPGAIKRINSVTLAITDPWLAGQAGLVGAGYRWQLLFQPNVATKLNQLRMSRLNNAVPPATVFDERNFDDAIVRVAPFGGKIAVATKSSLFLYAGQWDVVPLTAWDVFTEPVFSHGAYAGESEFVFLVGFRGSLFTWVANRVAVYTPGANAGWQTSGPSGRACYGGTVAGGYLVVALVAEDGGSELWVFDGLGWFRLRREEPGSGVVLVWPVALAGAGDKDLMVFRDGSTTYELMRVVPRANLPTYGAAGEWRSSLLDSGERGTLKGWARVGALFSEPQGRGNAASADQVSVFLDYSTDAGQTWATVASRVGGVDRSFALEGVPPAGTASRLLQVRVRWESVLDWAPVLAGVWADWVIEDAAAARSRWTLVVATKDGQVGRDGAKLAESGRQQIAALWSAWSTGATVVFRDIDFDSNPVGRVVTIADIEQVTAKAGDAGRWGEGTVKLTLSEA